MNSDDINAAKSDIKSDHENTISLDIKIKKLKIAQKMAITRSRKEKLLSDANDISSSIDTKIKSIALNKFIVRKVQRLKGLGKKKEEINEIITNLSASEESILDRHKNIISGFGIDKKFVGLSAEEILERVNALDGAQDENGDTAPALPTPEKVSDERIDSTVGTNQLNDEGPLEVRTNADTAPTSAPTSAPVKTSDARIDSTVGTNQLNDEGPLEVRTNADTDTLNDVEKNNERIYDYLVKSGELDIANYILDLMTRPEFKDSMKTSEIEKNTEEVKRLSSINSDIYQKLDELEEALVDEQDTSISIQERLEEEIVQQNNTTVEEKSKDPSGSFIGAILKMIFGADIFDLLAGGSLFRLAKAIIKSGWKIITKGIKSLVGPMLDKIKTWASNKIASISAKIMDKVGSLGKALSDKIGASKFGNKIKNTASSVWDSTRKKLGIPDKPRVPLDAPKKLSRAASEVGEEAVEQAAKKAAKTSATEASKKAAKLSASKITKIKPTGILKKLLKLTKPVPFLGTAIAAGTGIYAAQDGYRHADEILGKDKKDLTALDKLASAAGSLVNDVSFGLLSTKGTAEKIINFFNGNEIKDAVKKYEKMGIIDHDVIGNSEVLDWDKLATLPSKEIDKLIQFDDWSKKDLSKMKDLYNKRVNFEKENNIEDENEELNVPDKLISEEEAARQRYLELSEKRKKLQSEGKGYEFSEEDREEQYKAYKTIQTLGTVKQYLNNPEKLDEDLETAKKNLADFKDKNKSNSYEDSFGVRRYNHSALTKKAGELNSTVLRLEEAKAALPKYIQEANASPNYTEDTKETQTTPEEIIAPKKEVNSLTLSLMENDEAEASERFNELYEKRKKLQSDGQGYKFSKEDRDEYTETKNKATVLKIAKQFINDPEKLNKLISDASKELEEFKNKNKSRAYIDDFGITRYNNSLLEQKSDKLQSKLVQLEKAKEYLHEYTMMAKTSIVPSKQVEVEFNTSSDPEPVQYQMKTIPTTVVSPETSSTQEPSKVASTNPSDYSVGDLFAKYKVSDSDIEGLHPAFLHNLKAMAAEYLDMFGEKIQINSAFRSFQEQAALKQKYGSRAAAPGSSMHNYGVAVDMNTSNANKAIRGGLFDKYGFHRPVRGETWHVEPNKIDRAAIRASGLGGNPDVAKTANIPKIEVPKPETEGATPEEDVANQPTKSNSEIALDVTDPLEKERKNTEAQIEALEQTVVAVKQRRDKALEAGNQKAVESNNKWIKEQEEKIAALKAQIGESDATALAKNDVYKDKQIVRSEETYSAGVENTKSYDTRGYMLASQNVINNVNASSVQNRQGNDAKPSQMFVN
jgi:hypothetical protein